MSRQEMFAKIEDIGIIPAVRVPSAADALFAAETVFKCGIPVAEITMTIPGAVDVIGELKSKYPDSIVGAGTVLDVETAVTCVKSGADFITDTGLDPELVEFSLQKIFVASLI